MNEKLTKAKIIGFENLGFDSQWIIFNKARMFGWTGVQPSVLGTHTADKALDEAIDFLLERGLVFKKEK